MSTQTAAPGGAPAMPPPAPLPDLKMVALSLIRESATNPRRDFDKTKLQELADNIKAKGVMQPPLVRPIAVDKEGHAYELVFGARRKRASELAGLAEIPVQVRTMTDVEVLEVQLIENLHRRDLHELEEADGYRFLRDQAKYTPSQIAQKVDKTPKYINERLRLCNLCKAGREAFLDKKLSYSTALYVARIPSEKGQADLVRELVSRFPSTGEPVPAREVSEIVRRRFMLRLDEAPFSRDDAELVPSAGPCTTCVKRTGQQQDLFGDIGEEDHCTDLPCWEKKAAAAWQAKTALARAAGHNVLPAAEGEKLFNAWDTVDHSGKQVTGRRELDYKAKKAYVDLDAPYELDPKRRPLRKLIPQSFIPPVTVAKDGRGVAHELVSLKDAKKSLKAAGQDFGTKSAGGDDKAAAKRDENARQKLKDWSKVWPALKDRAIASIVAHVERNNPGATIWRFLWESLFDSVYGFDVLERRRSDVDVDEFARKATEGQLRGLVVEILIAHQLEHDTSGLRPGDYPFELTTAAKLFGNLDLGELEKTVRAELFPSAGVSPEAMAALQRLDGGKAKAALKSKGAKGPLAAKLKSAARPKGKGKAAKARKPNV